MLKGLPNPPGFEHLRAPDPVENVADVLTWDSAFTQRVDRDVLRLDVVVEQRLYGPCKLGGGRNTRPPSTKCRGCF